MRGCSERKPSILDTESNDCRKLAQNEVTSATVLQTSWPKAPWRVFTRVVKALQARWRQPASAARGGGSRPRVWIPARWSKSPCNRSARMGR